MYKRSLLELDASFIEVSSRGHQNNVNHILEGIKHYIILKFYNFSTILFLMSNPPWLRRLIWSKYKKLLTSPEYRPIISFIPFFFLLPDVLCDPTDVICRSGTSFEAMTDHTAFLDSFLAEVFRGFVQS